jgi:transcriptional regulator with XRE-family HTH domain
MHPQYPKAVKLRSMGKSYREIAKILNVSKSSLSSWFKNLTLSPNAQKILEKKGKVAKKQLLEFNFRRTQNINIENNTIRKKSLKEINRLSSHDLKLIGTALYWSEGYQFEIQKRTPEICFVNSNAHIIALFLRFLREIIKADTNKFRVTIHLYPTTDEKTAIKFWSQITRIESRRFHIVRQVSKSSQGKRPFNLLPYGTLRLISSGRKNCFRIQGWIDALAKQSH